jgi:tight adherence protein C
MIQSVGGPALRDRAIGRLDQMLILAGAPPDKNHLDIIAQQVMAVVLLPVTVAGILYSSGWFEFLFEGPKQVLVYVGLVVCGLGFPLFRLREQAVERQRQVALQLPDTLDLLTISVEAGLDFLSALRRGG